MAANLVCLSSGVSVKVRYCSTSNIHESTVGLEVSLPSKTGGLAGLADITRNRGSGDLISGGVTSKLS